MTSGIAEHVVHFSVDHHPAAGLLDRVRQGDAGALQSIIDQFWQPLLAYALRIVRCEDAAEDVVQRAMIRFWEQRERWLPGSAPQRILYTIVHNLAVNQLDADRSRARRNAAGTVVPRAAATPAQVLDEHELERALEHALNALPVRRREALILARFHHLSHAEIANVMGVAPRTVTNHITTAMAELDAALARFLGD